MPLPYLSILIQSRNFLQVQKFDLEYNLIGDYT